MYLDQYYNMTAIEGKFEDVNAQIFSAETTYQFLENKSVRLEAQHMWADRDKKNWAGGTLEFAYNANWTDRKSTRLNSSHVRISYAVFCLEKKNSKENELSDRCIG